MLIQKISILVRIESSFPEFEIICTMDDNESNKMILFWNIFIFWGPQITKAWTAKTCKNQVYEMCCNVLTTKRFDGNRKFKIASNLQHNIRITSKIGMRQTVWNWIPPSASLCKFTLSNLRLLFLSWKLVNPFSYVDNVKCSVCSFKILGK